MLTDVALSHYITKILHYLKENRLVVIASITKGVKIVALRVCTSALNSMRKARTRNEQI